MEYTRKRLLIIQHGRNSPRILDIRRDDALQMKHHSNENIIYLDKTGFNLHTHTNYGYSPKNSKAYINVPANKGVNLSLMAAISVNGVVGYRLQGGAYNGQPLISFI